MHSISLHLKNKLPAFMNVYAVNFDTEFLQLWHSDMQMTRYLKIIG